MGLVGLVGLVEHGHPDLKGAYGADGLNACKLRANLAAKMELELA
jgi:hypothetical protein